MVVLVIMVLIIAAMPIALNRLLPGYRFRAATEQLITELRLARSHAESQGRIVIVACQESSYTIQFTDGKRQKVISIPANTSMICTAAASGRVVDHLGLYPDGSATGGTLVMTDGKRRATIALSALTGHVRLIG